MGGGGICEETDNIRNIAEIRWKFVPKLRCSVGQGWFVELERLATGSLKTGESGTGGGPDRQEQLDGEGFSKLLWQGHRDVG